MESIATSSVSNISSTWYGKWEGKYEDCTRRVKKSIHKRVQQGVWSRGYFPGVNINSDIELREEITKAYIAWYTATKYTEMVKWSGSFITLLKTREQDKKVVPQSCNKNENNRGQSSKPIFLQTLQQSKLHPPMCIWLFNQ